MDTSDGVGWKGEGETPPSQFAGREGQAPKKGHSMRARASWVNQTQQQALTIQGKSGSNLSWCQIFKYYTPISDDSCECAAERERIKKYDMKGCFIKSSDTAVVGSP